MHTLNTEFRRSGPLKAVLFDWAGTIVDYGSRAPVQALLTVFRDFRAPISIDEARGSMGKSKREHIHEILKIPRVSDRWRVVHGETPDASTIDELYPAFLTALLRLLGQYSMPIPGTLEAFQWCRAKGLRIGSSTGYESELMAPLLASAAEAGLVVDACVCADEAPRGRPAPWLCLENARRLDVYPLEAIVVVDDTPVGLEAARNAGMWAIGVAKSGNCVGLSEAEFAALSAGEQETRLSAAYTTLRGSGAHMVIDSVADLPFAINQIDRFRRSGANR